MKPPVVHLEHGTVDAVGKLTEALEFVEQFLGREIESAAELTADEVAAVTAEAQSLTEGGDA